MAFGNVIYATNLTGDTEYSNTIEGDNIGMRAECVMSTHSYIYIYIYNGWITCIW